MGQRTNDLILVAIQIMDSPIWICTVTLVPWWRYALSQYF